MSPRMNAERTRLVTDPNAWRRSGPYLSERAWETVREDHSADGDARASFPYAAQLAADGVAVTDVWETREQSEQWQAISVKPHPWRRELCRRNQLLRRRSFHHDAG